MGKGKSKPPSPDDRTPSAGRKKRPPGKDPRRPQATKAPKDPELEAEEELDPPAKDTTMKW